MKLQLVMITYSANRIHFFIHLILIIFSLCVPSCLCVFVATFFLLHYLGLTVEQSIEYIKNVLACQVNNQI